MCSLTQLRRQETCPFCVLEHCAAMVESTGNLSTSPGLAADWKSAWIWASHTPFTSPLENLDAVISRRFPNSSLWSSWGLPVFFWSFNSGRWSSYTKMYILFQQLPYYIDIPFAFFPSPNILYLPQRHLIHLCISCSWPSVSIRMLLMSVDLLSWTLSFVFASEFCLAICLPGEKPCIGCMFDTPLIYYCFRL